MPRLLGATAALALPALVACGDNLATVPADAAAPPDAGACNAGPADRQWNAGGDNQAAIAVGARGEIYQYGFDHGAIGADNIDPAGDATGYVERLAGPGWPAWRYELATSDTDVIDALEVLPDGHLRIAGRSRVARPDGRPEFELVLAELDADGREVWRTRLGLPPSERPRQLASDGDHHVVAGYHDTYTPTNFVVSWEDPFLVAWSGAGAPSSPTFETFDTPSTDFADGVAIDAARDEILLASTATVNPKGGIITRYSLAGVKRDAIVIAPGFGATAAAVRRLPDGDVLIAGSTIAPLGDTPAGGQDVYVARYDAGLATRRWVRQLGTDDGDFLIDLTVAADGSIWGVAEALGALDPATPNRGASDLLVFGLEPDGAVRAITARGSGGDDRPTRIAVDACGGVLVAGTTNGDLIGGTPGARARWDAFVVRFAPGA